MDTYFIAWWNLENLFDLKNLPFRLDWLQSRLTNELRRLYAEPIKFGRPSTSLSFNNNGYSDHTPLVMELFER